jgi:hypothetical protein
MSLQPSDSVDLHKLHDQLSILSKESEVLQTGIINLYIVLAYVAIAAAASGVLD